MHIFDDNILKLDQKAYETEVVEGQSILPSYWCYFFSIISLFVGLCIFWLSSTGLHVTSKLKNILKDWI